MSKHSQRNGRRLHQAGMGGGQSIVRIVPRHLTRTLPRLVSISPEADVRRRCVQHATRVSVRDAVLAFEVPASTIDRWRKQYRADDLTSLEPRARRPRTVRKHQWTAAQEQAVLTLRQQYPRMGKLPLQVLLRRQGIHLSASMIGRILSSLRRRNLLRDPHAVKVRKAKPTRPYATRVAVVGVRS